MTISITLHPFRGHLWRNQFTATYDVRFSGGSSDCGSGKYGWFARVEKQIVFGQPIHTIEVLRPDLTLGILNHIFVLRAQMTLKALHYEYIIGPIDRFTSRNIFRYYQLILEFGFVRPIILIIFALLMLHPTGS